MLKALFFTVFAFCGSLVLSEDVIVFGDSWGTEGAPSFKKMIESHNMTVKFHAIAGTTAEFWARTPEALKKFVDKTPDAKYIWVTIGGNDAAPMLENGDAPEEIKQKVSAWTYKFYDPLFAAYPDIKVVQFGYDILFWDYPVGCVLMGNQIFSRCGKHGDKNFTVCANDLFFNVQQYTEDLATKYPQITAPNLLGSFQAAGKVPDAACGKPNPAYFSPNEFTAPLKECLHANDKGFDAIFKNLWDVYFAPQEKLAKENKVKVLKRDF